MGKRGWFDSDIALNYPGAATRGLMQAYAAGEGGGRGGFIQGRKSFFCPCFILILAASCGFELHLPLSLPFRLFPPAMQTTPSSWQLGALNTRRWRFWVSGIRVQGKRVWVSGFSVQGKRVWVSEA